jgi:cyclopropane-fatty-acyl-phospholipid synthase
MRWFAHLNVQSWLCRSQASASSVLKKFDVVAKLNALTHFNIREEQLDMPETWLDRCLLNAMQKAIYPAGIQFKFTGSSTDHNNGHRQSPGILVKDKKTLLALLTNPEMKFGDLYSKGFIEVEGDLVHSLETLYQAPERTITRVISSWLNWTQANTLRSAKKNIHHHYDLPWDFYQLWLDPELVYTCAYFPHEHATLQEAQAAKMELLCRKLWLRPGERVVEAGCGWGAFALYMARHYGVRVKAFNISHEQIEFARARARREGLASQVEFLEDDYRNIRGSFDAFVSIGMLEHLGRSHYGEFSRVIHQAIGDRGRGLLHFIGRNQPHPFSAWIRKRIFPGAYAPAPREAIQMLEPYDFSLLDVENLRPHYARTLECWLEAFERSFELVEHRFGAEFARMWRLYLAGSIAAFRVGTLQLFQLVFAGRACLSTPMTRERLYSNSHEEGLRESECIHATY